MVLLLFLSVKLLNFKQITIKTRKKIRINKDRKQTGRTNADIPFLGCCTFVMSSGRHQFLILNFKFSILKNYGKRYHYYITRDGVVHAGRALYTVGAHATGYNAHSIGICYEGGLDIRGRPCDTRTPEQKETLQKLLERLKEDYPETKVVGHRDLPGVKKDCPCFEV